MSMPTYSLDCNKCDYAVSSMILWGNFLYTDGETTFSCNKTMGWCEGCSNITPVEDFENTVFELEEIQEYSQRLRNDNGTFWQALLNLIFPSRRRFQHSLLNDIYSASKTLSLAQKRKGTECCLYCGSQNIKPINSNATLNLSDDMTFTGSDNTSFIHPGCGGELVSKGSNMRFSIRSRTRLYDIEGKLIEEQLSK